MIPPVMANGIRVGTKSKAMPEPGIIEQLSIFDLIALSTG
jgi:hypothetical protein